MITVNDLTKEFFVNKKSNIPFFKKKGTIKAVNNISFECKPGRIFGLIGPKDRKSVV